MNRYIWLPDSPQRAAEREALGSANEDYERVRALREERKGLRRQRSHNRLLMDGLVDELGAEEAAQGALVRAKELRADGGFGGGGCGAARGGRGRLWRRCGGGGRQGERWREWVRGGGRVMEPVCDFASGRGVQMAGFFFFPCQ